MQAGLPWPLLDAWCPAQSWERGHAKGLLDIDHKLEDGTGKICVLGVRGALDWLKPAEGDVTTSRILLAWPILEG